MIHAPHAPSAADVVGQSAPPEDGLVGLVTDLMERLGAPGAGLAVALENLFPPIPSEVILPLAGFAAAQGRMSLVAAIFWTTLGSVVGALALYWIGAALGRERTRAIAAKLPLVKLSDVDRTEEWFLRHGVKAVFFGRMIPIFRSMISIPAGVERMPLLTFTLYTTLGSLIWNTTFVMAGYLLGDNWHLVEGYAGILQKVVIVACLAGLVWFVVTRLRRSRRTGGLRANDTASAVAETAPTGTPDPEGRGTIYRSAWADDRPVTDQRVRPDDGPVADQRGWADNPAVADQPGWAEDRPVADQRGWADNRPAADQHSVWGDRPVAEQRGWAENQPVMDQHHAWGDNRPMADQHPGWADDRPGTDQRTWADDRPVPDQGRPDQSGHRW